jgi:regulator of cell morphogenesis and NO signaling
MAQDFNGSIADIVNTDYRTGEVFKKYNINYCCGGGVSLSDTCKHKNIEYQQVMRELKWVTRNIVVSNNLPFDQWELNFLIDYIINIHHTYIDLTVPVLEMEFISLLDSHEKQFPEIKKVQKAFNSLCSLLLVHNKQEDEIIFLISNKS